MRLRQVALVTENLDEVVERLCRELSLEVAFRDPGVGVFGLENAVMAVGNSFLEVVSPLSADCTAARFLKRRGGDSGYMVILQTDNLDNDRRRIHALGITIVWEITLEDIATIHLHPRDLGGAIVSLDQPLPPHSWRWAGPRWQETVSREVVDAVVAVDVQTADPSRTAQRWARAIGLEVISNADGAWKIELENAVLRFCRGSRTTGDGITGIDLRATGHRRDELDICGTLIRLV